MSREEARKLLGGFATGTLTSEEEQALFAAALDDQELFDALAKEQALRELLADPAARGQVLTALDEHPRRWWHWVMRPAGLGVAAAGLAAILGYNVWRLSHPSTAPAHRTLFADNATAHKDTAPASVGVASQPAERKPAAMAKRQAPVLKGPVVQTATVAVPVAPAPAPPAVNAPPPPSQKAIGALDTPGAPPLPPAPKSAPATAPPQPTIDGALATAQSQALQQSLVPPAQQQGQPMFRPALDTPRAQAEQMSAVARVAAAPNAPPWWTPFRRETDGTLTPSDMQSIHTGDSIVLRLTPPSDGYLTVTRLTPLQVLLSNQRVEQSKPIELAPLTLDQPGSIDLTLHLSAASASAGGGARVAPGLNKVASPPQRIETVTLVFR